MLNFVPKMLDTLYSIKTVYCLVDQDRKFSEISHNAGIPPCREPQLTDKEGFFFQFLACFFVPVVCQKYIFEIAKHPPPGISNGLSIKKCLFCLIDKTLKSSGN